MAEKIREIHHRDMKRYIELLRLGYSDGPAAVDTVNALVQSARLYSRFFYLWKCLSFFHLFPTIIPQILVFEKDGVVVGVRSARRRGGRNGPFFIAHIAVDPAFRRQKIARRLRLYFEQNLDPDTSHIILHKVLETNIPEINNSEKAGYRVYARETTFFLSPDRWSETELFLNNRVNSSMALESADPCKTGWHEIRNLKLKETPAEVMKCDPQAVFPFGRPAGISNILTNIFLTRPEWKGGIVINGDLAACGILIYHRLQRTYELDISALPEANNAVCMVLLNVMKHLSGRAKAPVNVIACDYQESVVAALKDSGFSVKEKNWLYCKKIAPSLSKKL
jgi:ribosomal protein S18 acetylase RimI-like enzyme